MRIKLHDDIEGHKSGETVDVPKDRADYYLVNGYASAASYNDDENPATNVTADKDPTLAENRKDKPNDGLYDQLADGLGRNGGEDTDDVKPMTAVSPHTPVELTNGKGDPEKADAGKEKLEQAAVATDSDAAPETNPELVEDNAAKADKVEAKVQKVEDKKS